MGNAIVGSSSYAVFGLDCVCCHGCSDEERILCWKMWMGARRVSRKVDHKIVLE